MSVIKQVQNADASQTGDPENVSNAIEQSADFSKFYLSPVKTMLSEIFLKE